MKRKGIILAGGHGTRLGPITGAVSKQLMPVYDKPMIFYSVSTLLLAGIREIMIISKPNDLFYFKSLFGNGSNLGVEINYEIQERPKGIAEAFIIAEKFINSSPSILILGDNFFHGNGLSTSLKSISSRSSCATIFAYQVKDPHRYGIVEFDKDRKVLSIEEKPKYPKSKFAVTGIYFYDETACDKAKSLTPSDRGELEITELNKLYLKESKLKVELFGRGMVWLDTGTPDSLHEASSYVRTIEHRQGLKIGSPEEIAWRMGFIGDSQLKKNAAKYIKSTYGKYLINLLDK
ncbi:glucose-1-phosphate thymidylyltransferase RfbA [Prochlorococcus sp. AH-716-I17]|nr:glucose-1-phosphate thymidylyltransferase RfbA [Prochlorococcus sp. AH-716-I17]